MLQFSAKAVSQRPFVFFSLIIYVGLLCVLFHISFSYSSLAQDKIELQPMWRENQYWKPETYDNHQAGDWRRAVDFYYYRALPRPDTYRPWPDTYRPDANEEESGPDVLAPHEGKVMILLYDVSTYARERGKDAIRFVDITQCFDESGVLPQGCIPKVSFTITPRESTEPYYIDVELIIAKEVEGKEQFRTYYVHLQINERFFTDIVVRRIKEKCQELRNYGKWEDETIDTGIMVQAGEEIGRLDRYGLARSAHLHFAVKKDNEYVPLTDSSRVTLAGQAILLDRNDPLCRNDGGIYRYPAMPRRNLKPGVRVMLNTTWDDEKTSINIESVNGESISLNHGSIGVIKEGPIGPKDAEKRKKIKTTDVYNYVWYVVQFDDGKECWTPGAYLDLIEPVERALEWLRSSQKENGSWSESTGITALVLLAFLNAGVSPTDPNVSKGFIYLLSKFDREHGRFYGDIRGEAPCYAYDTALSVLALIAAQDRARPNPEYKEVIRTARDYLVSIQYDNPNNPDDPQIGGWGYPYSGWADLSNTQFVVMALDAAYDYLGERKPAPTEPTAWTYKLLRFLDKCQNRDGGFGYRPGSPSWGSMTAAGVWCLLLAGLDRNDTRVKGALEWISTHYSLTQNPGRGSAALYYYLVTLAKALTMADLWEITTPDGAKHDWYKELLKYLVEQQHPEGYWVNANSSEWEGNKDLCTAYAVLALQTQPLPSAEKQLSWILTLHSPVELHVYDWLGRHVGRNEQTGAIDTEIPDSSYRIGPTGEQIIEISNPQGGRYRIELIGLGHGSFILNSEGFVGERLVSATKIYGTIQPGQAKAATATLTAMIGPITIYIEEFKGVPYGLRAVPGKRSVELSWKPFFEEDFVLAKYFVYRSTTSRLGYTKIAEVPATATIYQDTAVIPGTTYYYVISAVSSEGEETPFSREVSATPLGEFAGSIIVGPNPVGNDGAVFFYLLPEGVQEARILIFNVAGRLLNEIVIDPRANRYPVTGRWNPVDKNGVVLANGPYLYVLLADGRVIGQGKMLIQR